MFAKHPGKAALNCTENSAHPQTEEASTEVIPMDFDEIDKGHKRFRELLQEDQQAALLCSRLNNGPEPNIVESVVLLQRFQAMLVARSKTPRCLRLSYALDKTCSNFWSQLNTNSQQNS